MLSMGGPSLPRLPQFSPASRANSKRNYQYETSSVCAFRSSYFDHRMHFKPAWGCAALCHGWYRDRVRDGNCRMAYYLATKMKPLILHLKGCYFDAIRSGSKGVEYRLAEKWARRLIGKEFSEIHLLRGYPKKGDTSRLLRRKWRGCKMEQITHPHFGQSQVCVVAIDVTEAV